MICAVVDLVAILVSCCEVQYETVDLRECIDRVVIGKHSTKRIVVQDRGFSLSRRDVPLGQRFGTGNRIIASSAMDEVIAKAAIDNVMAAREIRREIHRLLQTFIQVDNSSDQSALQVDFRLS